MFKLTATICLLAIHICIFGQEILIPEINPDTKELSYLDDQGKLVFTAKKVSEGLFFMDDLAPVRDAETGLWGYMNNKGKYVIKPQFNSAGQFIDGYAMVQNTCKSNCLENGAGLLYDMIGSVINKKGLVTCTDNSQDPEPYKRYFLNHNLGHGFFGVVRGIGLGESQDFINYAGVFLGETVTAYGKNALFYDLEIQAVKCGLKYFDAAGKVKLDLTKFQQIDEEFVHGYVWSEVYYEHESGNASYLKVLIDSLGNPIVNMDIDDYREFTPYQDGKVHCFNIKTKQRYTYDIATANFYVSEDQKMKEKERDEYIYGKKLSGDIRLIYNEQNERLIGVQLKNGVKHFLPETL